VHAIAQIRGREARVLVHDPDRGFSLVETRGPGRDRRVELLNLGVVASDAYGDDLGDLCR